MLWKARFKGDFIAAVEFGDKKPTMTIKSVESAKLEGEDGRQKDKGVIRFKETERGWVYCKTTGFCLAAMFGEDDDKWVGKRVTLHAEMVSVGKEKQPGIRITGSPDIDKPVRVSIKLPKKKAFIVTLMPTGKGAKLDMTAPQPLDDAPPREEPTGVMGEDIEPPISGDELGAP